MPALWIQAGLNNGKYLVLRRDGTVPEWPNFVLGAADPAAPSAMKAYADAAEDMLRYPWGAQFFDREYIASVRLRADEFALYGTQHKAGDPKSGPHRKDNPTVARMLTEGGRLPDVDNIAAMAKRMEFVLETIQSDGYRCSDWAVREIEDLIGSSD